LTRYGSEVILLLTVYFLAVCFLLVSLSVLNSQSASCHSPISHTKSVIILVSHLCRVPFYNIAGIPSMPSAFKTFLKLIQCQIEFSEEEWWSLNLYNHTEQFKLGDSMIETLPDLQRACHFCSVEHSYYICFLLHGES